MDSVYMSYAVAEQGDSSSAEEVESPRSVVSAASVRRRCGGARWRKTRHQKNNNNKNNDSKTVISYEKNNKSDKILHSQVLRIKEEELQIEEDLMGDFGIFNVVYVVDSHPLDDQPSKIILPASPLGSKNM